MLVDLNKYKLFLYEPLLTYAKDAKKIPEPFVAKTLMDHNFIYKKVHYFQPHVLETKNSSKELVEVRSYWDFLEEYKCCPFLDVDIYCPQGNFEIPFEYYSRAYIEFFDFTRNMKTMKFNVDLHIPQKITFQVDSLGRLHVNKNCLASYIYCVEKKIPVIKCGVTIMQKDRITLENQTSLANKYLTPQILIEEIPGNALEQYTGKETILYKLLENADPTILEFCLPEFLRLKDFDNYSAPTISGFIFKDGSYLIMNGETVYHYFICKFIFKEDENWIDNNCVRIDSKFAQGKTIASYLKDVITPEAKKTLEKFKRKFYIEEQKL